MKIRHTRSRIEFPNTESANEFIKEAKRVSGICYVLDETQTSVYIPDELFARDNKPVRIGSDLYSENAQYVVNDIVYIPDTATWHLKIECVSEYHDTEQTILHTDLKNYRTTEWNPIQILIYRIKNNYHLNMTASCIAIIIFMLISQYIAGKFIGKYIPVNTPEAPEIFAFLRYMMMVTLLAMRMTIPIFTICAFYHIRKHVTKTA